MKHNVVEGQRLGDDDGGLQRSGDRGVIKVLKAQHQMARKALDAKQVAPAHFTPRDEIALACVGHQLDVLSPHLSSLFVTQPITAGHELS